MKYVYLIVGCMVVCACGNDVPRPADEEDGVTIVVDTEWDDDINVEY